MWRPSRFRYLGGKVLMSCRDTIHLICWYLEGKLSEGVERDVEEHLNACANCRVILEAATTTLDEYFGPSRTTNLSPSSQPA